MKKKYTILGIFGTCMAVTSGLVMSGILIATAPISLPIVAAIGAGTAGLVALAAVGGGLVIANAAQEEFEELKKAKAEQLAKECVDEVNQSTKNVDTIPLEVAQRMDSNEQKTGSLEIRLAALESKFAVHQDITENDIRDLKGRSLSNCKPQHPKDEHKTTTSTAANDETSPSDSDQKHLEKQQKEKTSETNQADLLINQGIFFKASQSTLSQPNTASIAINEDPSSKATKVRGIRKLN